MGESSSPKYYAVKHGREGPRIYDSWDETKENISRYPNAVHKSFRNLGSAQAWLHAAGIPYSEIILKRKPKAPEQMPGALSSTNDFEMEVDVPAARPPALAPGPAATPTGAEQPPTAASGIVLSPEQRQVLNKVRAGESVFFTGSAGTGKSVLLREIISWCRSQGRSLGITASTGIASVNIGGMTLHSWAGIGLGKESASHLAGKILGQDKHMRRNREQGSEDFDHNPGVPESEVLKRWRKTQTLIIDEISMIDGRLFDKLESIARRLRRSDRPFGGIQLVLSGDFCQLPPVPDKQAKGVTGESVFAFDAESWNKCVGQPVCLKKVFRQKQQSFIDMLNSMRLGSMTPEIIQTFKGLSRRVEYTDGLEPTDLFPMKSQVERENSRRLALIQAAEHRFLSLDSAGYDAAGNPIPAEQAKRLLKDLVAPEQITLKVGAQVMLIKNLVQGSLVNGSLGKVTGFCTVRDAKNQGIRIGIPEAQQKSNGRPPVNGQQSNEDVPNAARAKQIWPLVRFNSIAPGEGPVEVLCVPNQFEVNNADGGVEAVREQIPLILAWALSIHKSQGQTLERVRVDLGRIFEKGQAYVALSRATSMDTLEVRNFDPIKVRAHPRVLQWMKQNTGMNIARDEIDEDLEFWED